ncbi:hypothetical protein GCM10023153_26560 [Ornithinibacter aureus]|uniref:DNA-directed RNA polymerase specialized sigma24 family protein n=1 Tax=Ornithinibacter aureus TaxID=622664 RepID=A0ABP8K3K3_9MICO|nr:hypothetical protein [Ornithinibacter aureus]KAF0832466.1 DNA-directed RNA polymerase specialized sigma24 family protein [Ornithinibacter aureus]
MNGADRVSEAGAEFVAFAQSRQPDLLRAAYLVCGDVGIAQEVLRHVFVTLARQWGRVEEERPDAVVRHLLHRDAVASCRRREAPSQRYVPVDDDDSDRDTDWDMDEDADQRRRAEVMAALDLLPPAQRSVVVACHLEDHGEDGAAPMLGRPLRVVRREHESALALLGWTPDDAGANLELASEDLPETDLVGDAWAQAGRQRRAMVRRTVLGAGVALVGGAVAAVALREPEAPPGPRPAPTPSPSAAVADGRLPLLTVQGVRVYLAPDPRSEANLPEYPLREELAFPQVLGAGPVGERAVLGEQGLTGVSTGVRGVFMVATSEDRSSPVLYAPNAPTPYVLVPSVRMPLASLRSGPLGPRSIDDDRHRVVFHRPAAVVILDARDGSVIEVPVPDPTIAAAGWARDGRTVVARGRDTGWLIDPESYGVRRAENAVSPDWSDLVDSGGATVLRTFSGEGELTGTKDLRGPPIVPHSTSVSTTEGWVSTGAWLPETYQREVQRSQGLMAAQGDLPPIPRVLAATEGPLVPAQCYRALGWGPSAVVFLEARSQRPGFQGAVRRVLAWDVTRARLWRVADIAPASLMDGDFTGFFAI